MVTLLRAVAGCTGLRWRHGSSTVTSAQLVRDAVWSGFAVHHDSRTRQHALKLLADVLPSPADMQCMCTRGLQDGQAPVRAFAVAGSHRATRPHLSGMQNVHPQPRRGLRTNGPRRRLWLDVLCARETAIARWGADSGWAPEQLFASRVGEALLKHAKRDPSRCVPKPPL